MTRADTPPSRCLATPIRDRGERGTLASQSDAAHQTPEIDDTGKPEDEHRSLWASLTPTQRHLLGFVWRHEDTDLTYLSIARSLELPSLPGVGRSGLSHERTLSDKTIRKVCKGLFDARLLVREGERGAVRLTPSGHALVLWSKAQRAAGLLA